MTTEALVCSRCGTARKPTSDRWTKALRSSGRRRRLKRALERGRASGLQELTRRYGEKTNIDLEWITRNDKEISTIFHEALGSELASAGVGLKDRDVEAQVPTVVERMKAELRDFVRRNPD